MREQLLALFELQKIDSRSLEIERQAENIPKKISQIENGLEVLRSELGSLNAELEVQEKEQGELESTVAEESTKHKRWKRRLNDIKSPREYQALSREIELGERQVNEQETKALDLLAVLEEKQKVIADKETDLKDKEGQAKREIAELRKAHQKISADAAAASQGREVEEKKLPARVVKRYSQVRKQKNGIAVALVKDGTCTGCNMRLRPQQEVELLRCSSWESCPNCNRLLVHANTVEEAEQSS